MAERQIITVITERLHVLCLLKSTASNLSKVPAYCMLRPTQPPMCSRMKNK